MKRLFALLLVVLLAVTVPFAPQARASAYDGHPRLVIILVIDQFRGDYLDRYRADFKGRGFRLFLDRGAYFEDCYYDYANTKTAPGHATLGTGAYTDRHGISSNEWWDLARNKERPISSVEDERYRIVGLPNASESRTGASPRNLRASTLGDELRLATGGQSKVFGISLKDRAAILPAGYAANGAYWIDAKSGYFTSSSYYMQSLPAWAAAFNDSGRTGKAAADADIDNLTSFYEQIGPTPAANAYELDFAKALITGEQMGRHAVTDLLTVSLSANDLIGHQVGPDSPVERQMVDSMDVQLDGFFTWLEKNVPGGLANVWVALSADHGVAPVPAQAAALGMPAAAIDLGKFTTSLNLAMNAKFSPGEKIAYLLPKQELPYIALNQPSFEVAGINEQEAEQAIQQAIPAAVSALAPPPPEQEAAPTTGTDAGDAASAPPARDESRQQSGPSAPQARGSVGGAAASAPAEVRLPPVPVVVRTYTRQQLAAGELPPSEWGELLAHSYSANGGWYVMVIPTAYQMESSKNGGTTHFSPWSYDQHVPLGFYGAPFTPGIYHGRVQPVDLAATLASLLGINQPSASIGHVLTQAIHNVTITPAGARKGRRARGKGAADETTVPSTPAPGTTPATTAPAPGATPAPEPVAPSPTTNPPGNAPATQPANPPAANPAPSQSAPQQTPPAQTPPAQTPPAQTNPPAAQPQPATPQPATPPAATQPQATPPTQNGKVPPQR